MIVIIVILQCEFNKKALTILPGLKTNYEKRFIKIQLIHQLRQPKSILQKLTCQLQ